MIATAVVGRALLDRAIALAERDPDRARDLLVEAAALFHVQGSDEHLGDACELMGRIALSTGMYELATEPLGAALHAHARRGDAAAEARVRAALALAIRLSRDREQRAAAPVSTTPDPCEDDIMATVNADEVLTRARDLVLQGAFTEAAPLYERGGRALLGAGKTEEGVTVLIATARLRTMMGELDAASALLDELGRLASQARKMGDVMRARAEVADQRGDMDASRVAWQAAYSAGDRAQRLFALARLTDIARATESPEQILGLLDQALALVTADEPAQRADILVERAVTLTMLGHLDDARAALSEAESLAVEDRLLAARIMGQRGVIALVEEDVPLALELGREVRRQAVEATDVPTYVSASMLIFMAHQSAGETLEAYDTLLRARVSLSDLQGEDGAQLVQPAIDNFAEQLGKDELEALHERWVAWRTSEREADGGGEDEA